MNDEKDPRPYYWIMTNDGVMMAKTNNHQMLLNQVFPNFNWSHGACPWEREYARGEIEVTDIIDLEPGEEDLSWIGHIFIKLKMSERMGGLPNEEIARAVVREGEKLGAPVTGFYSEGLTGEAILLPEYQKDPVK
jgi:hypothetical protein